MSARLGVSKISPELVSSILGGLVLVLGGLGTYSANRSIGMARDRKAHRQLQKRFLVALRHIFRLESDLADLGVDPPPRPAALEEEDDEPIAPPPSLPPQPHPRPPTGGPGECPA